ncbi:hypothetical protein [Leptospira jelokensis]|uniref:hypothetical protein n=1 Tax=Leptospira jelokensis TaxID=2484931 RepID=UPI0010914C5D|nr:hypothetical protein [Leptospira jelokensis]TGL99215.1 hypothetical protein EHQ79_15485 [Leptospira jelokensis]
MKILLIDPHIEISNHFQNNQNVHIFRTNELVLDFKNSPDFEQVYNLKESELQLTILKLRKLGPLWVRWTDQHFEMEMILRESLQFYLYLKSYLKNLNVKYAIFHTSICHHLYDNIVQMVLEDLKIPQIFLYGIQVCNRLLPLIQSSTISDRKSLDLKVNSYNGKQDIALFESNLKQAKPPALNVTHSHNNKSIFFALFFWLQFFLKLKIKGIKSNSEIPYVSKLASRTFFNGIQLLLSQREAIKFYQEKMDPFIEDEILSKPEISLLIAAHYQPEATTFPEGGEWNNYLDQILLIRSHGYQGTIYFKEHPASFSYYDHIVGLTKVGCFRSVDFYQSLLKLGCKFVPPTVSLKEDSRIFPKILPITMTGSIAIERSLLGYPTIVTGFPWYTGMPGCYSLKDIKKALRIGFKEKLILETKKFLIHKISNHTLVNAVGIATGLPTSNPNVFSDFLSDYEQLINTLRKK